MAGQGHGLTARGHQVILGRFTEPRLAAAEVLHFFVGNIEAPPSPTKLRNKKGQGPRSDTRHAPWQAQVPGLCSLPSSSCVASLGDRLA